MKHRLAFLLIGAFFGLIAYLAWACPKPQEHFQCGIAFAVVGLAAVICLLLAVALPDKWEP